MNKYLLRDLAPTSHEESEALRKTVPVLCSSPVSLPGSVWEQSVPGHLTHLADALSKAKCGEFEIHSVNLLTMINDFSRLGSGPWELKTHIVRVHLDSA